MNVAAKRCSQWTFSQIHTTANRRYSTKDESAMDAFAHERLTNSSAVKRRALSRKALVSIPSAVELT